MMNILHKTAQVADFRPGFVPKVQLRAPRVARPRLVMVWSVDLAGRLAARWHCEDEPGVGPGVGAGDPLGALPRGRRPISRASGRRPLKMEGRHGRRA